MKRPLSLAVLSLSLLLAACAQPASSVPEQPSVAETGAGGQPTPPHAAVTADLPAPGGAADLPTGARLGEATVRPGLRAQALPASAQTNKVALRVLVLSSGAGDYGLDSARAMLQASGVPYDVLDASRQTLDFSALIDAAGAGRYQGVVLTSSALIGESSPGVYLSALDSGEWATLFEYEKAYGVRQLALYGYPGAVPEDYGLRAVAGAETSTTALTPSAAGRAVFSDLTGTAVPVQYAYSYPSVLQSVAGVSTTPLLSDAAGRVLAATSTVDGRERLLLTTAQNPALLHTSLLGYGLVQWLTRGVHLGEHRRFLQVDIDDWFLEGDHFDAATLRILPEQFRLSASDALGVASQQRAVRSAYPVARNFRYAVAFNGAGAYTGAATFCFDPGPLARDPLSSVSRCLRGEFDWVNHTLEHQRMDVMDAATVQTQIASNFAVGDKLGLNVSRSALITPEHSGLGNMDPGDTGVNNAADVTQPKRDLGLGRSNPNLLAGAVANGVRYLASDRSVPSQRDPECVVCGVPHPLNPGIFLVPRWPNAVAYHVTTPAEATAYYNSVYGPQGRAPYWDHNLSYAEFLDQESGVALNHFLTGAASPHYMHQPNLDQYASGKSLATDWVRAALDKYSRYSTLPLNTLRWDDLGAYVQRRTREEKDGASGALGGVWDRQTGRVTLSGNGPATLSGASAGTLYGGYRAQTLDVAGSATVAVTPR